MTALPTALPTIVSRQAARLRTSLAAISSVLLVLAGSAAALVITADPAAAHDVLVSTTPANGSTVARTPDHIVLTFTDPALAIGTQVSVTGPSGAVPLSPPRLVDTTVVQDLPGSSPAGAYTVRWRVTSSDGHPVSGELSFTSRAAGPARGAEDLPTAPSGPSTPTSATGLPVGVIVGILVAVVVLAAVGLVLRGRRRGGTPAA